MAVNKVVYAGRVLIDLTEDTVTADKVLEGTTFHKPDGTLGTGTMKASTGPDYLAVRGLLICNGDDSVSGTTFKPPAGSVTGSVLTLG